MALRPGSTRRRNSASSRWPIGTLMIAGEFDLSIGSVIGATSIVFAIGTNHYGVNAWIMLVVVFAIGGLSAWPTV